MPGTCVGAQTSTLPSLTCAVALIGSIVAWARYGARYTASITRGDCGQRLARVALAVESQAAFAASRWLRAPPGSPASRARRPAAARQSTCKRLGAALGMPAGAAHHRQRRGRAAHRSPDAPRARHPAAPAPPHRSRAPGLPPSAGRVAHDGVAACPGSRTSMPKRALPLDLAAMSVRGAARPISFHALRGFSATLPGGVFAAALHQLAVVRALAASVADDAVAARSARRPAASTAATPRRATGRARWRRPGAAAATGRRSTTSRPWR